MSVLPRALLAAALWPSIALADDAAFDTPPKADGLHSCLRATMQLGETMRAHGARGIRSVKLAFRIGANGAVENPAVAISSEDPLADGLALKCVTDWRYHPATKAGAPVAVAWDATVSFNANNGAVAHGEAFDAAASDPARQTCKVKPAAELETLWSKAAANIWSRQGGANDQFECLRSRDAGPVCRAKPGTALYPTLVATTFYSTGARLKVGVDVQTAGDCKAALPLTFKNELPVR
ncbi:MAG TPA: TonB family protein [Rhizomicrobium sp.]|nr:TonB family protein [Rhizomicrobium sp.]